MMDREPLIVNFDQSISEVSHLAMARREERLYDYVIVTNQDQYQGVVTIKDLLEHATQLELNYARHLNPLTGLPGNLIIEDRLTEATRQAEEVAVVYVDINNFKAYNDIYGFENGDKVIQLLANLLADAAGQWFGSEAFVGHVGGDDYVLIVDQPGDKLPAFCSDILTSFDKLVAGFYCLEHYEQGYVYTLDRDGIEKALPLMSLSVATLVGAGERMVSPVALAEQASKTKHLCKLRAGSCFEIVHI
jgi:GGDEF domain-containing protein